MVRPAFRRTRGATGSTSRSGDLMLRLPARPGVGLRAELDTATPRLLSPYAFAIAPRRLRFSATFTREAFVSVSRSHDGGPHHMRQAGEDFAGGSL